MLVRDFAEYLELIEEYRIPLTASILIGSEDAVQCITAHKAKGLEYNHVYAIGLTEKQYKRGKNTTNPLPANLPLSPEKDNDEDILRLVYTVCTRAKDRLILTHSRLTLSEKPDSPVSVLASIQTWTRMELSLPESISPIFFETEKHDLTGFPYTQAESQFLRDIVFHHFHLSVTALQNFLDVSQG